MKIKFSDKKLSKTEALVIVVTDSLKLGKQATSINKEANNIIKKAIKSQHFKGKKGSILSIPAPEGVDYNTILLASFGKEKDVNELGETNLGGKIIAELNKIKAKTASVLVEGFATKQKELLANMAYGALLRSYRFDKYKTKEKTENKPSLQEIDFCATDKSKTEALFKKRKAIADGVFLARTVVTEPPNILYPESYAEIIKKELSPLGVKITILDKKQMEKLNMGALLGVGQGSIKDSRLVVMEWNGGAKNEQPLAFVGKGVTFDTGGISLKPAQGMEDMKYDMGGSAAVVGLLKSLASRKAKVNAVGVVGLVENMPGHNAQRPSDVVKTMSGQTVEVLNTDAEGRLVLADALWYTQEEFKPQIIVDLATLTGAIVIALGSEYAGIFSNNDSLCHKIEKAGNATGERLWRFPLGDEYDKLLDSPIADMQNISNERGAGSITAAQFLKRFIKDGTPWAHLDIAGMAWTKKDKDICPKGATAFGVRVLERFVSDNYEK